MRFAARVLTGERTWLTGERLLPANRHNDEPRRELEARDAFAARRNRITARRED